MLRIIIIAGCIFVSVLSCKKYNDLESQNEFKDTCTIYGRLFLLDTLTQRTFYLPQAKKKILIVPIDATNEVNYLFSSTTDDNGYFTFKNLTKGSTCRLVYEENISGKLYRADTTVVAPFTGFQLLLKPSLTRQTGIYVTVLNGINEVVPKATVCLFTNEQAFLSGKCDNSNYTMTADAYGQAFQFGISKGRYFVLASATIGNVTYSAKDTIDVSTKVEVVSIRLSTSPPVTTGLQYTVLDTDGFPVNDARVCLYLNPALYNNGNCQGSNYSDSTNSLGIVSFTGIEPQTYYSRGEFVVGNRTYSAVDTITVVTGSFAKDTLRLQ